jgi:hypothetical protein
VVDVVEAVVVADPAPALEVAVVFFLVDGVPLPLEVWCVVPEVLEVVLGVVLAEVVVWAAPGDVVVPAPVVAVLVPVVVVLVPVAVVLGAAPVVVPP